MKNPSWLDRVREFLLAGLAIISTIIAVWAVFQSERVSRQSVAIQTLAPLCAEFFQSSFEFSGIARSGTTHSEINEAWQIQSLQSVEVVSLLGAYFSKEEILRAFSEYRQNLNALRNSALNLDANPELAETFLVSAATMHGLCVEPFDGVSMLDVYSMTTATSQPTN